MKKKTLLFLVIILGFASCRKDKNRYLAISKIQTASKLATTETTLDKIIFGSQERKFLGMIRLNETRFVAYSKATVKTGIDLSKLRPEDVKITESRIEVALPAVEVLDFSYPSSSFRIDSNITDTHAFLNNLDIKDFEEFYQMAEIDIRNNLSHMGIKDATEQKTRILMIGLLKNLGYEEIYISFRPGKFIQEVVLPKEEDDNVEVAASPDKKVK
jgi:Protein of unknown function (DUF4230)